jgi:hypothetical protein
MALEMILDRLDSSEMGRQFFNKLISPFFGMSLIRALRKLGVSLPVV